MSPRALYVEALIKHLERRYAAGELDTDLMDRIERMLGLAGNEMVSGDLEYLSWIGYLLGDWGGKVLLRMTDEGAG